MVLGVVVALQGFLVSVAASGITPSALSADQFLLVVGGGAALVGISYVVQVARRMQGLMAFRLKRAVMGLFLYVGGAMALTRNGYSAAEILAFSILLGLTPLAFMKPPRRSRKIPKRTRDAVIARDLKGEPFDPKRHNIHHIVPFSKGGDNSLDNLKVISKEANLRKGAKMPGLRDLWNTD